jgi:hypothetical protein
MRLTERTPEEPRGLTYREAIEWGKEKVRESQGTLVLAEIRMVSILGDVRRIIPCVVSSQSGDVVDMADLDDISGHEEDTMILCVPDKEPAPVRFFESTDENAPLYKVVPGQDWTEKESAAAKSQIDWTRRQWKP